MKPGSGDRRLGYAINVGTKIKADQARGSRRTNGTIADGNNGLALDGNRHIISGTVRVRSQIFGSDHLKRIIAWQVKRQIPAYARKGARARRGLEHHRDGIADLNRGLLCGYPRAHHIKRVRVQIDIGKPLVKIMAPGDHRHYQENTCQQ
ncbi:MAG: hypothetical protein BWX80_02904 [Candidatus Hydrogenedentes bacterium ADurb.Bin101]|nr:MAG: hypothetical protein BWX80_02904 [Candidatus Hydrogenedentes bacterium ADurb.Bin101]